MAEKKGEKSIAPKRKGWRERNPRKCVRSALHLNFDDDELIKIHDAFLGEENEEMDRETLRDVIMDVAKITFEDEFFELTFLRMNTKRDGMVNWDEFVSHLLLGFKQSFVQGEVESLEFPISGVPRVLKSNHRHAINRIAFCPTMRPDRTISWNDGSYMTGSKDGYLNYWSLDLQHERSVQSTCPSLVVQSTWVTDFVVMPDVSVVCTASSERDLRFYDTSARKFELRIMIAAFPHSIMTMFYRFTQNVNEDSMLVMGDMSGNLKIIFFNSESRGPFKSKLGMPLLKTIYDRLVKGYVAGMRIVEFNNIHSDFVRQVSYYESLHCIISCAACPNKAVYMTDVTESKISYVFKLPKGAWCFAFDDKAHILVTGSSDCIVRIWNPFLPAKPSFSLVGHHAGIVSLILQDGIKKLFSLSKDRWIKIWDVAQQTCIQTYLGLPSDMGGERSNLVTLYNPQSRQIVIGCNMLSVVSLCPLLSAEHTDGFTHTAAVTVVLYNPLFRCIVTCGLDSAIIVWDPWLGRRLLLVRQAHTRMLHAELLSVEITTATFDPDWQFLLTGASDGSLKMWDFNTGTCLRNMTIEAGCEVSSVIWVKGRILAIGWNQRVIEYSDAGVAAAPGGAFSKPWDTRHSEDVLYATAKIGETLATSSYSGELVLWRLETGQAYKRYNVANPTGRIKLHFKQATEPSNQKNNHVTGASITSETGTLPSVAQEKKHALQMRKVSVTPSLKSSSRPSTVGRQVSVAPQVLSGPDVRKARRLAPVTVPESCVPLRGIAVHCMLFLSSRETTPHMGTLLLSLENGNVQVWSHHPMGGFITSFQAIHSMGAYVIAMATDENNEYLMTGDTAGYMKIWLMANYAGLDTEKVCMPRIRLTFPFLWKDVFLGRAKRTCTEQPKPLLLSSIRAHLKPVTGLTYINENEIIVTCSADHSTRLWTLGCRYLGTLGSFKPWTPIKYGKPIPPDREFKFPPDVQRLASSTTFRVLNGGAYERRLTKKQERARAERELSAIEIERGVYGKRIEENILGKHFQMPKRSTQKFDPQLDTTFSYIPVYSHLSIPEPVPYSRPPTPPCILVQRIQKPVAKPTTPKRTVKTFAK